MIKRYLCLAAAAAIFCLASPAMAAPDFNPADLLTFTTQDLQAADADASQSVTDAVGTHMKDPIAHQCYAGVLTFMASPQGASTASLPPAPSGVISAFQSARDLVKGTGIVQAQGLLPTPIIESCGALYLDAKQDILRVGTGLTLFGLKLF